MPQIRCDTVYRKFKLTARAMEQQFGADASPAQCIKDLKERSLIKNTRSSTLCFREADAKGKLAKAKPFASIYYHADSRKLLSEGGFDDFPFMVPRFNKDSSSSYGRSVSMNALPDTKMLNKMSK